MWRTWGDRSGPAAFGIRGFIKKYRARLDAMPGPRIRPGGDETGSPVQISALANVTRLLRRMSGMRVSKRVGPSSTDKNYALPSICHHAKKRARLFAPRLLFHEACNTSELDWPSAHFHMHHRSWHFQHWQLRDAYAGNTDMHLRTSDMNSDRVEASR